MRVYTCTSRAVCLSPVTLSLISAEFDKIVGTFTVLKKCNPADVIWRKRCNMWLGKREIAQARVIIEASVGRSFQTKAVNLPWWILPHSLSVETIHRADGDEAPGAQAVLCLSVASKSDQPLSENLNQSCPGRRGVRPEMMGDSILPAHMGVFGLQEYWLCPNAPAHLVWHEGCHQSGHSCPSRAQRLSIVPSILMWQAPSLGCLGSTGRNSNGRCLKPYSYLITWWWCLLRSTFVL